MKRFIVVATEHGGSSDGHASLCGTFDTEDEAREFVHEDMKDVVHSGPSFEVVDEVKLEAWDSKEHPVVGIVYTILDSWSRDGKIKGSEMSLREFIQKMDSESDERDVHTDYTDDLAIAYVGDGDVELTDVGKAYFIDIMKLRVRVEDKTAVVLINHFDEAKAELMDCLLFEFFNCAAGNCSTEKYERYFKTKGKED